MKKIITLIIILLTTNFINPDVPDWAKDNKEKYLIFWKIFLIELEKLEIKNIKKNESEGYIEINQESDYLESGLQISAYNIFLNCLKAKENNWPFITGNFLNNFIKAKKQEKIVLKDLEDFDKAIEYLYIKIFPTDYKEYLKSGISREDIEGTISAVVINFNTAVKNLDASYLEKWNKNNDEIFEIALKNTLENTTKKLEKMGNSKEQTIYFINDPDDIFLTTNIYDLSSYDELKSEYGCCISIPSRNYLLILPLNNKEQINNSIIQFMVLTDNVYNGESYQITANIFWYYNGKIFPIKHDDKVTKESIKFPDELIKLMQKN